MDEQLAPAQQRVSELFARWDQFVNLYDGITYGAVLVKNGETWHSFLILLTPLFGDVVSQEPLRADYGNILIVRGLLSLVACKGQVRHDSAVWLEAYRAT